MLFKTYQKITTLFKEHHGYMSFADLRDHQVTVLQLAEMEEEGSLERFARGWYWCKDCGYEKPEDYQYIEIAKVNPRAVICMDSAAWLAGMLKEEPPISEASVLLQEYRCLFSVRFYKPMPIIEQKYQDCCAICFKIPLESARYYAIIIKKERISIKYKKNFRLFSRTTRQRPCWHGNLTTAGCDNGPNV